MSHSKLVWRSFAIKTNKNTAPRAYIINDLNGEEIVETFYKKELKKKANQKYFRVKKVIKRIGDELCAKWKVYDNSFNSWINKQDTV